jgi:signal transduction histidine kinase
MKRLYAYFFCLFCTTPFFAHSAEKNFSQVPDDSVEYNKVQKETINFVNDAIKYYQKVGFDQAMKAFSSDKQFKKGQFYIFVLDRKGNLLSHGYNLKAKDNINHMQSTSKHHFVESLFNAAQNPNGGWYAMLWHNPASNGQRQLKILYVKELPCLKEKCEPMLIGSGYH